MKFEINMNVKRCEASLVDWITGKGKAGPGFHIYCYYEEDNEIKIANPLNFEGFVYKRPYWESCYQDYFKTLGDYVDEDNPPYCSPKYGC